MPTKTSHELLKYYDKDAKMIAKYFYKKFGNLGVSYGELYNTALIGLNNTINKVEDSAHRQYYIQGMKFAMYSFLRKEYIPKEIQNEWMRKLREKNPERHREIARRSYHKNKEKHKERMLSYYYENKERILKRQKEKYYKKRDIACEQ